jgi:pimeloyl-ACP methyl ester carboxylesterase
VGAQFVEVDLCQALRLVSHVTGHARVVLLGHSLGAALACATAAALPDLVSAVVCVRSAPFFDSSDVLAPMIRP